METVVVLPIFFLASVTMISFMDLYKIQTEHLVELCQSAKEAAMYAYNPAGGGLNEIYLPDMYSYQPIRALVPLSPKWFTNTVNVHAWTGVESPYFAEHDKGEHMVLMAESGSVIHKSASCSYLNLSISQVSGTQVKSMKNQNGERYYPCESCSIYQSPSGRVFVTAQGNRYHNSQSCSRLKRTVVLVKESASLGYGYCSRCGG